MLLLLNHIILFVSVVPGVSNWGSAYILPEVKLPQRITQMFHLPTIDRSLNTVVIVKLCNRIKLLKFPPWPCIMMLPVNPVLLRQLWFMTFFIGSITILTYTCICKHFQFKNNINNKNPIHIIC